MGDFTDAGEGAEGASSAASGPDPGASAVSGQGLPTDPMNMPAVPSADEEFRAVWGGDEVEVSLWDLVEGDFGDELRPLAEDGAELGCGPQWDPSVYSAAPLTNTHHLEQRVVRPADMDYGERVSFLCAGGAGPGAVDAVDGDDPGLAPLPDGAGGATWEDGNPLAPEVEGDALPQWPVAEDGHGLPAADAAPPALDPVSTAANPRTEAARVMEGLEGVLAQASATMLRPSTAPFTDTSSQGTFAPFLPTGLSAAAQAASRALKNADPASIYRSLLALPDPAAPDGGGDQAASPDGDALLRDLLALAAGDSDDGAPPGSAGGPTGGAAPDAEARAAAARDLLLRAGVDLPAAAFSVARGAEAEKRVEARIAAAHAASEAAAAGIRQAEGGRGAPTAATVEQWQRVEERVDSLLRAGPPSGVAAARDDTLPAVRQPQAAEHGARAPSTLPTATHAELAGLGARRTAQWEALDARDRARGQAEVDAPAAELEPAEPEPAEPEPATEGVGYDEEAAADAFAKGVNPASLLLDAKELAHDREYVRRVADDNAAARDQRQRSAAAHVEAKDHSMSALSRLAPAAERRTGHGAALFADSDDELLFASDSEDAPEEGEGGHTGTDVGQGPPTSRRSGAAEVELEFDDSPGRAAGAGDDGWALEGGGDGDDSEDSDQGLGAEADVEQLLAQIDKSTTALSHALRGDPRARVPGQGAAEEEQAAPERARSGYAVTERIDVSDFASLVPHPALGFPFELDGFQKEAIAHMERGDSVFVAAHTSAGKTVVAEYAMALCKQHMTRCVYTSPIKALSNQKFRDFKDRHSEVGLMTGDAVVDEDSSCVIMTTEILRSMLYRGADLVRDVEWVVFDEVHYVNDIDRGVVWEEVIIMLPPHVRMVFLSATTPNTIEFCDWIGRTRRQPVHVIKTSFRPVPLRHFLYAPSRDKLDLIMGEDGRLWPNGHSAANEALTRHASAGSGTRGRGGRGGRGGHGSGRPMRSMRKAELLRFTRLLRDEELLPAVVFAFSKRKCEESAASATSLKLLDGNERSRVHVFFEEAMARLSPADRGLPQVQRMRDMLQSGVGVHHGGLLPILKEVVEILFGRGLVRVLFATETFAMGVNMPARTVVFHSIRKHDGRQHRYLLAGEYTQMSGRAGRRGLDSVGTVITLATEQLPDLATLSRVLTGKPVKLQSQFRLKYAMILNLLRVEDMQVEDMIKRSFSEVHTQRLLGVHSLTALQQRAEKRLSRLREAASPCILGGEPAIEDYVRASHEVASDTASLLTALSKSARGGADVLAPGRVVCVTSAKHRLVHAPAMVLRGAKGEGAGSSSLASQTLYLLALHGKEDEMPVNLETEPVPEAVASGPSGAAAGMRRKGVVPGKRGGRQDNRNNGASAPPAAEPLCVNQGYDVDGRCARVLCVPVDRLQLLSRTKLKCAEDKELVALDPAKDLRVVEMQLAAEWQQVASKRAALSQSKCHACPQRAAQFAEAAPRVRLEATLAHLRDMGSDDSLALLPEYHHRLSVLKRLGYVDAAGTVQVKGRVASAINTCDELLLTEMIFENVFADLDPEEVVAVLSAFVFERDSDSAPRLPPRLDATRARVAELASALGVVQLECGMDALGYAGEALHWGLAEVAFEWARGVAFSELCQLTNLVEGEIVRTINRVSACCAELQDAARVIGDPSLFRKAEDASATIKRDIVFTSSLYL